MTDKQIHIRYNLPNDEWHNAYFDTEPGADAFCHTLDERGTNYEYKGLTER